MLPTLPGRRRPEREDERLLRLFWNRAELKREFAKLQRERDRMLEHLRQQEGATLRIQQRLDQLEGLLAEPLRAANVAVYFQLRAVWHHSRRRLVRLGQDLAARQQELERERDSARFRDNQAAALAAIDQRVTALAERRAALELDLATQHARRSGFRALWGYFGRRNAEAEALATAAAIEALDAQLERYQRARGEKAGESCVPVDALGVDSRRAVNGAVIALAQELALHFHAHGIVLLARDAAQRGPAEASYGNPPECRALAERIQRALAELDQCEDLPARVRRRAAWLRRELRYRRDDEATPGAGACESIPLTISAEPEALAEGDRALDLNVLADDYWDVYGILLP